MKAFKKFKRMIRKLEYMPTIEEVQVYYVNIERVDKSLLDHYQCLFKQHSTALLIYR